jgi:hypothetical protein
MRVYLQLAAAVALALAVAPGAAPAADEGVRPEQPAAVESKPADTWTAVLDNHSVQPILGKEILSPTGENMGRIVDVIVDGMGQTRAAVIDFGGFLGVGSRKIVVDWNALHFSPRGQNARVTVDLTRDQLKAAPEYRSGKPVVVVGALGASAPEM